VKKIVSALVFAFVAVGVATSAHALQATANWSAPVDPNRTGIRVERQDGGVGAFVQQGALLGPSATTFNQTGLVVGTQYCYQVIPVGDLGDGPVLGPACGTPNTPAALNGLTIIFAP
jgi:hypothetical protein